MSLRKDFQEMKTNITDIRERLEKIESVSVKKSIELEKTKELLKDVKVKVSKAAIMFDEPSHNYKLRIDFQVPSVDLILDSENRVTESSLLKALNLLGILDLNDSILLSKKLQEAKEKNKQWQKQH